MSVSASDDGACVRREACSRMTTCHQGLIVFWGIDYICYFLRAVSSKHEQHCFSVKTNEVPSKNVCRDPFAAFAGCLFNLLATDFFFFKF